MRFTNPTRHTLPGTKLIYMQVLWLNIVGLFQVDQQHRQKTDLWMLKAKEESQL